MSPNTKTDRSQSAPHDSLAQPDRADLARDGRARARAIEHPVLFVLVGAVALAGLLGGLSSGTARNGLRSARRRPRPPRHPLRRRGRYLRPLLGQRRPDQAIDRPHRANDRQSRSNLIKGAVALRATPTRVEQTVRTTYQEIIRGRTSQVAGAAMNTCSRVSIALCIPAGLFALASFVPRPAPAVIACRDSQDALAPCWRGTKDRFQFRKTADPSGAVHLVRPTRVDDTDGETTASLTLAGLSRAVPLPPRRPKHLNR